MFVFVIYMSLPLMAQNPKTQDDVPDICPQCLSNRNPPSVQKPQDLAALAGKISGDHSCLSLEISASNKRDLKELIIKDPDYKNPLEIFVTPNSRTSTTITYKFPEKVMKPGDSLYFAIPEDLQNKPVSFVVVGHRQDPSTHKGQKPDSHWDDVPGLTSFQVHATNQSAIEAWRYWTGDSSGKKGAKFAEPRHELEKENLYEWVDNGTKSVANDSYSKTPVHAYAARLVNVGKDDVYAGEVTIKFLPPAAKQFLEGNFTKGTIFNVQPGQKASYQGGQKSEGIFPGAVELGGYNSKSQTSLPKGWKILNGFTLAIPVPKGKKVTSVEIVGGDSHPDKVKNKDGGWGTSGWAKLSLGVGRSPENADWFVKNENVPPEGLMLGSPTNCNHVAGDNEYVYVRGTSDTLYLMGVRVGLN